MRQKKKTKTNKKNERKRKVNTASLENAAPFLTISQNRLK